MKPKKRNPGFSVVQMGEKGKEFLGVECYAVPVELYDLLHNVVAAAWTLQNTRREDGDSVKERILEMFKDLDAVRKYCSAVEDSEAENLIRHLQFLGINFQKFPGGPAFTE